MSQSQSSTQKKLPAPVNVKWDEPKPKKGGTVPRGQFKGRDRRELRALAVTNTKQALEHANSNNPPRNAQWTDAIIKHGFDIDSSKTQDRSGRWGTSRPHVNVEARATNKYTTALHIGYNSKIEPKPEDPKCGPFKVDDDGTCYPIPAGYYQRTGSASNQRTGSASNQRTGSASNQRRGSASNQRTGSASNQQKR